MLDGVVNDTLRHFEGFLDTLIAEVAPAGVGFVTVLVRDHEAIDFPSQILVEGFDFTAHHPDDKLLTLGSHTLPAVLLANLFLADCDHSEQVGVPSLVGIGVGVCHGHGHTAMLVGVDLCPHVLLREEVERDGVVVVGVLTTLTHEVFDGLTVETVTGIVGVDSAEVVPVTRAFGFIIEADFNLVPLVLFSLMDVTFSCHIFVCLLVSPVLLQMPCH